MKVSDLLVSAWRRHTHLGDTQTATVVSFKVEETVYEYVFFGGAMYPLHTTGDQYFFVDSCSGNGGRLEDIYSRDSLRKLFPAIDFSDYHPCGWLVYGKVNLTANAPYNIEKKLSGLDVTEFTVRSFYSIGEAVDASPILCSGNAVRRF